jgi:urea transport system permease protein
METDALALSLTYQFGTNAAFLFLAALGLIVILGMMNIINLAHGELMMMGAYVATITHNQLSLPFPLAVIVSFFAVAIFGAILELLIVRRFYGRELGALVVTWGISLILGQGTLLVFGPFMEAIKIPGGSYSYGGFSYSAYWLILIAISIALIAALYWLYRYTNYGLQARATMQNAEMAKALGVPTNHVYTLTFSLGAGLAGLSGALLAPTSTIAPFMGQQFVAPAFITVVVAIKTPIGMAYGAFLGTVALLVSALIIIRIMPDGISAAIQKLMDRRRTHNTK